MITLRKTFFLLVFFSFPYLAHCQTIRDRYIDVLKLQGQEKHDRAIKKYKRLISDYPTFGKAYKSLAEVYIDLEKIEEGESYFSQILSKDSLNAYAFYGLARFQFAKKNYSQSIDYFKTSISLDPQFVDTFSPNGGLIQVYQASGGLDKAIQYLDSLSILYPKNPNITYAFARVYQKKYNWQKCVEMLNRTMEIDSNYAYTYHALATYLATRGKYKEATKAAEKMFELSNQQSDLQMAAYALSRIGVHYLYYGDYWKALQFNNEGYKIAKSIGAKYREGYILNNIATLYAMLGLRKKALQYFYSSLELVRKSNSNLMEIRALLNIGNVLKELKNFAKSEENYRVAEKLAGKLGYKFEESLIATSLSEIYQLQKKYGKAAQNFKRALNLSREIQDKTQEGYILRALGSLYLETGNYEKAIKFHNLALDIGKKSNDLQIIWEAQAGLGSDYKKSGKIRDAIYHYSQAIALYDSVRSNLDIGTLANNFLEDKYEAFPSIVQLLAGQDQFEKAFFYAEKYKSKIMLDILAEGQIYIEELLPDSLRSGLDNIRQQIETFHKRLSKEYEKQPQNQEKIVDIDHKITELKLKKAKLLNQIREDYSNYFQLTSTEPVKIAELQAQKLDKNQVLLEYILGPEKISVFVIKKDTSNYFEMDLSRNQLLELLKNISPMFDRFDNDSTQSLQIFNADIVDFSIPAIYELYRKIFQPVEYLIPENSHLIIVPDDLLFYIPFEMLIFDTTKCRSKYDFRNSKFLLEKYSISYSSSASLLDSEIKTKRNPGKGFFAIGNPDFKALFPRDNENIREFRAVPQLPNSEIEVKKVNDLLKGINRLTYVGTEATEQRFKEKAPDYRVVHLATHFFFNDRLPLYSKLVLTKRSQDSEDGFLNTYEIFNMNFRAELIVLSACNSALGKLSRGEGLLGISRSFLYAGVPSLLLSLWSVDDEATSEIMVHFYKYLKEGKDKNRALQLSKLDFIKTSQPNYADPFYWAPFILIGDQSPVNFSQKEERPLYKFVMVGVVFILVILVGVLMRKKKFTAKSYKKQTTPN